jgi:hypothetical protein
MVLYNILSAAAYIAASQFLVGNLLHNDPKDRNLLKIYLQSEKCSTFYTHFYQLVIFQEQKEESFQELSEVI